ncbi:insecticyanin-A-like [Aricia agestis]|uniref:insecticyanin-A-like n=1 Tax=Aricia agestis TaxID=91739 RepID=UPI001C206423|nr:insecticyanin-A-like [Aricia agestis]
MDSSKILVILLFFCCFNNIYSYFTLPGQCPDVLYYLQEDFRLADFYGKWYQSYHYSSDGQNQNNCSSMELMTRPSGIYLNISRVDRGLFHRFSVGKLDIPVKVDDAARLDLIFGFKNAPRRLKTRRYPFHVLATNYKYYATVYTCQYSPLIDKHYVYVWVLSRHHTLNEVSKELALKPLREIGIKDSDLLKDEFDKCEPKYYEDFPAEPLTFRFPVPI